MDFVLGLVLSLTDNASAGMNNAVQSLNSLTSVAENASSSLDSLGSTASLVATSISANMIGDNLIKAGTGMMSLFDNLIAKTKSVGSEYENFGVTLSALGMNSDEALKKLFAFSNKSPLEVGDVKDMIVTLQAQGINAFDETTGAISGTRQEFLAFLTDLKSFKPEVSNERFKRAIQNYIGSGEKTMMRTVFDMGDIEDIIGHAVSDTAEGRMQDIVEMVENKGLTGLSRDMAETWQGVASNIDDAFTRIFYSVANDGGVFEKLKSSFVDLANVIIELPEEELASIGKTIGSALNTIVEPLTKLVSWAKKGISSLIELSQTHPALLKWGIVLTTVAGGLLVFSGVIMKVIGSLASFVLVMQNVGGTIKSISQVFKIGLADMSKAVLPLVGAVALLAVIWKSDFAGIRTTTVNFVTKISNCFKRAKELVDGSIVDMVGSLRRLRNEDSFWSNIVIGLMKIYGAVKFVSEAWDDNTLSYESYEKARELGILPLIEAVLDLKYRFEHFKKGFISGWKEIGAKVKSFIDKLKPSLEGTVFESLVDGVTDLLQALSNNDPESWEKIGSAIGKIAANGLLVFTVLKPIMSLLKPIVTLVKTISEVGGAGVFSSIFKDIGKYIAPVAGVFGTIALYVSSFFEFLEESGSLVDTLGALFPQFSGAIEGFASAIGGISAPVVAVFIAIIAIIGSVVAFAKTQKDKFNDLIDNIKQHFSDSFNYIKDKVSTTIQNVKDKLEPAVSKIKDSFDGLKDSISHFTDGFDSSPIIEQLGIFGEFIMSYVAPIVNFLIDVIGRYMGDSFSLVGDIISSVCECIGSEVSGVIDVISGLIDVISGIIALDFDKVTGGFQKIADGGIEIKNGIVNGLTDSADIFFKHSTDLGNNIMQGLVDGYQQHSNLFIDSCNDAIKWAKDTFDIDSPSKVFEEIGEYLIEGLLNGVNSTIEKIVEPFTNVLETIKGVFDKQFDLLPTISSSLDSVSGKVTSAFSKISGYISTAISKSKDTVKVGLNKIDTFFGTALDTVNTKVANVFSNINSKISNTMDSMRSTISSTLNKIQSFFKNCKLELPHIKVPHFKISGGKSPWGLGGKGTKPSISIDWYAKGGVFDEPSIIGVGEKGKEAVMPLENNTGWIDTLASSISSKINVQSNGIDFNKLISSLSPNYTVVETSVPAIDYGVFDKLSSIAPNIAENNIEENTITPVNNTTNTDNSDNSTSNVITRNDNSVTTDNQYLTRNNNVYSTSTNSTKADKIDNSVHFEKGSIVIQAKDFSESEARKFVDKIIRLIKRKKELNDMLNYKTV